LFIISSSTLPNALVRYNHHNEVGQQPLSNTEEQIMKKSILALTAVAALSLAGSALAVPGMGPGMGPGAGMGPGKGAGPCVNQGTYTEQYKKFAAETLPIRQEMMNKHFDLQKEMLKDKPDAEAIKKLQGEVGELRKKMIDAHTKAGLPMGKMGKRAHKGMRGGMMGKGMGMMQQDCPLMTAPPAAAPAK
jgi:zinc resistance-associated protein